MRADRSRLLRVVAVGGAGGAEPVPVVPDVAARLPGRGAWVHHDLACFDLAVRRRAFARALRVQGPVAPGAVRRLLEGEGPTSDEPEQPPGPPASTVHRPPAAEAGQRQMGTR